MLVRRVVDKWRRGSLISGGKGDEGWWWVWFEGRGGV